MSLFSDAFVSLWVLKSLSPSMNIEVAKLNLFSLHQHDQTGSGAYPASISMGIGVRNISVNCNWVDSRWQ